MVVLTSKEHRALDNVSRSHDADVYLGRILSIFIREYNTNMAKFINIFDTPVNASHPKATLTLLGVVHDGEKLTVGPNVYELIARDVATVTLGCIPIDISAYAAKATGNLTLAVQPTAGDKVTVGTKVYTFVPVGTDTADGEVSIGSDLLEAQANIVSAINGVDGISDPHPLVTASEFLGNVSAITAHAGGTAGNSIATTSSFTSAANEFDAVWLATGTDCSAENAVIAIIETVEDHIEEGMLIGDGDGEDDSVNIFAPLGASYNGYPVSTTIADASFGQGVTGLSGGQDTTEPAGVFFRIDDTNLYIFNGVEWCKLTLLPL